MFARTPAPWTSSTGPRTGSVSAARTITRLSGMPSPASNGTKRSTYVVIDSHFDQIGDTLGKRRDRPRRIDADRLRHDRAVRDVKAGVTENLAAMIDDAVVRTLAHSAAAERVRRDQVLEDLPGQRHQRDAAGLLRKPLVHRDEGVHHGLGALDLPFELEPLPERRQEAARQAKLAVGRVACLPEPWH